MRRIFERQWLHVLLLVVLMGGLAAIRHTEGLLGAHATIGHPAGGHSTVNSFTMPRTP